MNPREEQPAQAALVNFDPVAEIYDDTRDRLSDVELRALASRLHKSKTLEVAVGTGRLAKPLQDQGVDVTGIDISTRMLNRARLKDTKNLVRAEVTHLPFKPSSFDAVLTVHFLHLIPDWPGLIREVARVAKHNLVGLDTRTRPVTTERTSGNHIEGLHDLYLQRLEKKGFMSPIRPHGELRLAEKVKPSRTEVVDRSTKTVNFDRALDLLEKKTWALTWTVPEELHREIVKELRAEIAGRSADFVFETILLVWRISDVVRVEPYL